MNKNFLNNQNYILGRRENREILSKFFIEKIIKKILFIFSYVNSFLYNEKYNIYLAEKKINIMFVFLIILAFISMFLFAGKIDKILGILYVIIPFLFFIVYKIIKLFEFSEIKNIKCFFWNESFSYLNYILMSFCLIFILNKFPILINKSVLLLVPIFLAIIFFLLKKTFNFFNFLFSPFILIFLIWFYVISYISTYILRKPLVIKLKINSKTFTKFRKIGKYYAENKYYIIKIKK